MTFRLALALSSLAVTLATTPAAAQDFNGDCRTYTDQAACKATGWCLWRTTKPRTTPAGTTVAPKSSCAFRPGFKAAWTAQSK